MSALLERGAAATRAVKLIDDCHTVTLGSQPHGRRQATKPGTDHHGVAFGRAQIHVWLGT